jgi:hypothetical protein
MISAENYIEFYQEKKPDNLFNWNYVLLRLFHDTNS